jgi:hypothetical protein
MPRCKLSRMIMLQRCWSGRCGAYSVYSVYSAGVEGAAHIVCIVCIVLEWKVAPFHLVSPHSISCRPLLTFANEIAGEMHQTAG